MLHFASHIAPKQTYHTQLFSHEYAPFNFPFVGWNYFFFYGLPYEGNKLMAIILLNSLLFVTSRKNLLNQSTVTSTLVASSRIHHCRTLLVVYRRGGVVVAPLECTPLLSVLQINTTDLTTLGRYGGSLEHKHSTLSLEKKKKYPVNIHS